MPSVHGLICSRARYVQKRVSRKPTMYRVHYRRRTVNKPCTAGDCRQEKRLSLGHSATGGAAVRNLLHGTEIGPAARSGRRGRRPRSLMDPHPVSPLPPEAPRGSSSSWPPQRRRRSLHLLHDAAAMHARIALARLERGEDAAV